MKKYLFYIFTLVGVITLLSSCGTRKTYNYDSLAQASRKLKMDIDKKDNHKLYIAASNWIGVPYRSGGSSKKGTDCSGFTTQIYKEVYKINLPRNTTDQRKQSSQVRRSSLKEGDLVFFKSKKSKKKVAHVGIYLKDGKFVHASTSRGVIVSNLSEKYYKDHWLAGGRVQK